MITVTGGNHVATATALKKLAVSAPGWLLLAILLVDSTAGVLYGQVSPHTMLESTLNALPVAVFILISTLKMKQRHIVDIVIQISFFIYIWGVLSYTILPLPFADIYRSITGSHWMADVLSRVDASRHLGWQWVNLVPFHKFSIYSPLHVQVTGNLALLFPLGFYLPLLYRKGRSLLRVLAISLFLSLSIETTQLVFSLASDFYHRTFDVDDIILNTLGACLGYGAYRLVCVVSSRLIENAERTPPLSPPNAESGGSQRES